MKQFTYIKFFLCKDTVLRGICIISFNTDNSRVTKVLPRLLEHQTGLSLHSCSIIIKGYSLNVTSILPPQCLARANPTTELLWPRYERGLCSPSTQVCMLSYSSRRRCFYPLEPKYHTYLVILLYLHHPTPPHPPLPPSFGCSL